MNDISEYATPFPHRAGNIFKIQYSISWDDEGKEADNIDKARELYEFMTPYVSKKPREAYLNYRDLDIGTNKNGTYKYGVKYFKKNFDRLVSIKSVVDPSNFFRNEQSIPTKSLLG
ncbi:cannabidiolic acid synthase [Phtheirospermum japonicum]|uniref:Cannabidiolic acid synthase n=1 Tax=Phtheirospermum japonicum TaxID=374723 RepID=A0A830C5E8_9LAMI|nr:cannabidiolic acid synthase [Phtheirospermum japonicum]